MGRVEVAGQQYGGGGGAELVSSQNVGEEGGWAEGVGEDEVVD